MKKQCALLVMVAAFFLFNEMTFAQMETETRTTFLTAVTGGDAASVRAMLKSEPALSKAKNDNGVSAILLATYYGISDIAAILLDSGLELDIFEASATGQTELVKALTRKDKSLVNSYSPDGFLPLGLAIFFGREAAVSALLDAGANINLASKETMRVTPLHSAVAARRFEIGKKLIKLGAKVNAKAENDFTPLHEVAASGDLEFAKVLVENGADVNAKTKDGKTPLLFAITNKRIEMETWLRGHGAK